MFKMSLYILKTNETRLLQMNFEEILNQIQEQPKLILCADCQDLNKMERIVAYQDGQDSYAPITFDYIDEF